MFDWRGFTNLCCHLFPEMFTACVPCFSEQTKAGLTYQRTPTPLNRRGSDLVEPESCSSAPELACRGERRAWRQTTSRVAAAAAGRMTSSGFHHGDRCDFDIARPRSHKNVMMQRPAKPRRHSAHTFAPIPTPRAGFLCPQLQRGALRRVGRCGTQWCGVVHTTSLCSCSRVGVNASEAKDPKCWSFWCRPASPGERGCM